MPRDGGDDIGRKGSIRTNVGRDRGGPGQNLLVGPGGALTTARPRSYGSGPTSAWKKGKGKHHHHHHHGHGPPWGFWPDIWPTFWPYPYADYYPTAYSVYEPAVEVAPGYTVVCGARGREIETSEYSLHAAIATGRTFVWEGRGPCLVYENTSEDPIGEIVWSHDERRPVVTMYR